MTIRGGGNPHSAMAAMPLREWTRRLGALPQKRMTASWSGPIRVQPNTSVVRAIDRGQWQAPLGSSRGQPPDRRRACRRAHVRQGQTFGGAEEAPSLTAAARDGDGNMQSRRKNARGAGQTKEWNDKGRQKWRDAPLTKKAMRESRTYGSVRGARDETRVPTATKRGCRLAYVRREESAEATAPSAAVEGLQPRECLAWRGAKPAAGRDSLQRRQ